LKFLVKHDKGPIEIYPGETKQTKWWPTEKMKLSYSIPYAE
jgi:hypothetical protein